MSSAGSPTVCKDWLFVSKGTEISLGKFVSEHFTPLTLNAKSEVISTEDTPDIWEAAKGEALEKARRKASRQASADSPRLDEAEVEKSFWLSRPDGWVVNRKIKRIVLSEFKRTDDSSESYYLDMRKAVEKQHTPIQTGLNS